MYFKAVCLIFIIIKRFKLVNSEFMKFIEIIPPLIAAPKLCPEICVGYVASHLRRNIKRSHGKHIDSVSRNSPKRGRHTLHNPGMNIVQAPAKHGVHDKFAHMLLDFYGDPAQYAYETVKKP